MKGFTKRITSVVFALLLILGMLPFNQLVHAAGEAVDEYDIPTANAFSSYIINGPDGKLWFSMYNQPRFGIIDPATGVIAEHPLTPGTYSGFGLAVDPSNNVWIATGNGLSKIDPITYGVTDYAISGGAYALSLGGDGYLYFTQLGVGRIGKFELATTTVMTYNIPTGGSMPGGIVRGNDGKLYFTMENADKIGVMDPSDNSITEYYVGSGGVHPFQIAIAADGNIWFTEYTGNIGKFDVSTNIITEYPTPTPGSGPYGIYAGSDGNIWFAQHNANQLARMDISTGAITEFPVIPTGGSGPYGIVSGPDGNIWFTEANTNKIAKLYGVEGFQPPDTTAPTITSFTPADNATDVPTNISSLTITFDEPISNGPSSGNLNKLFIKRASDNAVVYSMGAHETPVFISGNTVVFDLVGTELDPNTAYYVQFGGGAFRDAAGNYHMGVGDTTTWNFTTASANTNSNTNVVTSSAGLTNIGTPNTGLARQNTLLFVIASAVGISLLVVLLTPLRKRVF